MSQFARILSFTAALALLAITTGCDGGGGSDRKKPVGPDLQGKWVGIYFINGGPGGVEEVTARVKHNGERIVINTSRPNTGIAGKFTGRIDSSGDMVLTDNYDAETWTTHEHVAREDFIEIEDFRRDISDSALAVMRLNRR